MVKYKINLLINNRCFLILKLNIMMTNCFLGLCLNPFINILHFHFRYVKLLREIIIQTCHFGTNFVIEYPIFFNPQLLLFIHVGFGPHDVIHHSRHNLPLL